MANESPEQAWISAETNLLAFFAEKLSAIEGTKIFLPQDFPKTFTDNPGKEESKILEFSINGGDEVVQIKGSQKPFCAWQQDANLRGIFISRVEAQKVAGIVRSVLPLNKEDGDAPNGIQRLTYTEQPTITPDTIQVANDKSEGGEKRVWVLVIPMEVVYNNIIT